MGDIINFEEYLNKLSEEEKTRIFMNVLDNLQFGDSVDMQDIISDLVNSFRVILKALRIEKITEFTFVDYEYPRLIIINGKEYDLDGAFDKDADAGAALYEIDALIADLVCDFGMKSEQVLKLIEKEIKK